MVPSSLRPVWIDKKGKHTQCVIYTLLLHHWLPSRSNGLSLLFPTKRLYRPLNWLSILPVQIRKQSPVQLCTEIWLLC